MIRRSLLALVLLPLVLAACGPDRPAAQPSAKCPPPSTEVPLAQMMTPAFHADYVGCHVKVKARFFTSNSNYGSAAYLAVNPILGDQNAVFFRIGNPQGNSFYDVKLPKDRGGFVFELKQGDPIVLTGGTLSVPLNNIILFLADSIERGTP